MNRSLIGVCVGVDGFRLVGPHTSIATYTEELIDALIQLGCEITIYAPRREAGSSLEGYEEGGRGSCHVVVSERLLRPEKSPCELFVWNQLVLPDIIARRRCDVFISTYHQTPWRLPYRIPVISVIHDLCGLRRDCGYRFLGRAWLRHLWNLLSAALFARRIVPISYGTRREMLARFPFCKSRLARPIHNRVTGKTLEVEEALDILRPFGVREPGFILGFAHTSPRKGFDVAVRGYISYRDAGGDASLVLIGVDDENQIKAWFPQAVSEHVFMLPRVSVCERDSLYRLAACLLFCSRCEGFGYPIVESMRQGCPVIAGRWTPAAELTGGGLELLDALEEEQCSRLLSHYTTMTENSRRSLSAKLIAQAETFSQDAFAMRFSSEIQSVLKLDLNSK